MKKVFLGLVLWTSWFPYSSPFLDRERQHLSWYLIYKLREKPYSFKFFINNHTFFILHFSFLRSGVNVVDKSKKMTGKLQLYVFTNWN